MTLISNLPEFTGSPSGEIVIPGSVGGASYGFTSEQLAAVESAVATNCLDNTDFQIWQRGGIVSAESMVDGEFVAPDRWYSLIQGSGSTIEQSDASTDGAEYAAKIIAGGTANRFGIAQPVCHQTTLALRNQTVTFQIRCRPNRNAGSGTMHLRAALLAWTGTANSVAADVVSNWSSGSFTTGNFFGSTSLSMIGTASDRVVANHNEWTDITVSGSVDAGANNIVAVVWTEDAPVHASDFVEFTKAGLFLGSQKKFWTPTRFADDLLECKRFHYTTVRWGTETPANGNSVTPSYKTNNGAISSAGVDCEVRFHVPMIDVPSVTYYRTAGATNDVWAYRDTSVAAWEDATSMSATVNEYVAVVRLNGVANGGISNSVIAGEASFDAEIIA